MNEAKLLMTALVATFATALGAAGLLFTLKANDVTVIFVPTIVGIITYMIFYLKSKPQLQQFAEKTRLEQETK